MLSIKISQLLTCKPESALNKCSTVLTSISFDAKLVENLVDTTLSHVAGIITDLSVLLKKIPEPKWEGFSVILF